MSKLSQVTKGKIAKPYTILIYGPEKVGKSTFAAGAPNPIFIGPEKGTSELDVSRYPESLIWHDLIESIDDLIKSEHDYKTLVVDSLDWCEPMLFRDIIKADAKAKNIETALGGYGKGYVEATRRFVEEFFAKIDILQSVKKMHVIFIAHAEITNFSDPYLQTSYSKYDLKLHKRTASKFKEYVDAVLFAQYESFAKENDEGVKTHSTGERVLYTEHQPTFNAGNRYGLPHVIKMDFKEFDRLAKSGNPNSKEALTQSIESYLLSVPEEIVLKSREIMATADVNSLVALRDRLKTIVEEKGN
jgi:AAA domain